MFKHIIYGSLGWDLSQYFDYITAHSGAWPEQLRGFASSEKSYDMHGRHTLHDTRLLSASIKNDYNLDYHDPVASAELIFIDQMHEGVIKLTYERVLDFKHKAPVLKKYRTADVLMHEFDANNGGTYTHRILIDQDGAIEIEFANLKYAWEPLH